MTIFQTYTGNAMLNNALLTIEALASLEKVQDITPNIIKEQFDKYQFWSLYKRMKSYTMLFTRNNLLTGNNKEGAKLYKALFDNILGNVELQGKHQCEISGLRFETTFSDIYKQTQRQLKEPEKGQGIDRCWFPLIGSLGSDAQALPQAKYDIRIHPVCLVLIQFLPLSALLYKGSILLFDTVNFDFARDFISQNVKRVQEEIDLTPSDKQIENIKDNHRGKYILQAIELFFRKQNRYQDKYTDINLWSFNNSGTGASCEVDRVPNLFFKKLVSLYAKTQCRPELMKILSNEYAGDFLRCFENELDFSGLYPAKNFEGVSVPFFEEYHCLINKSKQLIYAKYIAGLLRKKALAKSDEKLLGKTDAYAQEGYLLFFQKTLIEATGRGEWGLQYQLNILDNTEVMPVKNSTYKILKMVHFFYQKNGQLDKNTTVDLQDKFNQTLSGQICAFVIRMIEKDTLENHIKHAERLSDPQKFEDWRIYPLLIRQAEFLNLAQITKFLFWQNKISHSGLNNLLRFYFSQKEKIAVPETIFPDALSSDWLDRIEQFSKLYMDYYQEKYTGDRIKFKKHVLLTFPDKSGDFTHWLADACSRMSYFYKGRENTVLIINQSEENLCYDDEGNKNTSFARFAVEFNLNRYFKLQHIS